MQVRCPQCHTSIDLTSDGELSDIACPTCGSSFSLLGSDETTPVDHNRTRTIGHFELVEQIGVGTFGAVWRARDIDLDRVVAVKVPRKGHLNPQETEQFLREARAAAQLRHPGIVSVHEVGREQDTVYIVSDYVDGVTLADRLTAQPFSSREAAELCEQIADALQHAHEAGVVHRDLKSGNIMLDSAGRPHILDFGLARREAGEVTMTVEGRVLGTPAYLSPEQAQGSAHSADGRSDVYSLGVILFELLTGERPFRGNIRMLLHQVIHDEPPSPRRLNGGVPRDLETICLKCLQKERGRRYQTAGDLAGDLRRYLGGEPIKARPVGRVEGAYRWCRRNPAVSALTAIVVLVFLTGFATVTWMWREAVRQRDLADSYFFTAQEFVDDYFTQQAKHARAAPQLGEPSSGLKPVGRELLVVAAEHFRTLAERRPGDQQLQLELATAYRRLAESSARDGESARAVEEIQQSVAILDQLVQAAPQAQHRAELASALEQLGNYQGLGDELEPYERCYELRRSLGDEQPDNATFHNELANICFNIGHMHIRNQQVSEGIDWLSRSADIRKRFVNDPASAVRSKEMLAYTCEYLSDLARGRDPGQSLEFARQAVQLRKEVAAQDPASIAAQNRLAESYNWLALAHAASGDRTSQLDAYLQARDIRQHIVDLLLQHQSIVDSRYYLLRANNNLSVWQWETNRLPEAIETLRQIVRDGELVVAAQPDNGEARRILAWGYSNMAFIQSMLGEGQGLLAAQDRALELLSSLAAGGAPDDGLKSDIATALCRSSGLLLAEGRVGDARKRLDEAAQLLQSIRTSHYEIAFCRASWNALMAQVSKQDGQNADGATRDYVQHAIEQLEQAIAWKHPTAVRDMQRDRNLDGIRDEPLFQQLLAAHEPSAAG